MKKSHNLHLHRETLCQLASPDALHKAAGGATNYGVTCTFTVKKVYPGSVCVVCTA